ncbi:MAG: PrsW family glutamic-type intramembrane protease [Phycisphaerales bacterium]|nr:PrsW family glutamic-type intramembrane protease [Phycisphaerales bacterium]
MSASLGVRQYFYMLLLLALIPLAYWTFQPRLGFHQLRNRTIAVHPELRESTGDDLFRSLPGNRFLGALLPRESNAHWLMAVASLVGFLVFIALAVPRAREPILGMCLASLFTATVGIMLIMAFQYLASAFTGDTIPATGGGRAFVVFLVMLALSFIGMSYALADDPSAGFMVSLLGFSFGVGLCEEITKLVPLLKRIRPALGRDNPTWNTLLAWGLASGAGLGVAEGIMYSRAYYNGIHAADMYLVRFISCVALHAIWTGTASIILYRRQFSLEDATNKAIYVLSLIPVVLLPMILHGLYNTLLKKGHNDLALATAIASFAILVYLVETMRRKEPQALLST